MKTRLHKHALTIWPRPAPCDTPSSTSGADRQPCLQHALPKVQAKRHWNGPKEGFVCSQGDAAKRPCQGRNEGRSDTKMGKPCVTRGRMLCLTYTCPMSFQHRTTTRWCCPCMQAPIQWRGSLSCRPRGLRVCMLAAAGGQGLKGSKSGEIRCRFPWATKGSLAVPRPCSCTMSGNLVPGPKSLGCVNAWASPNWRMDL